MSLDTGASASGFYFNDDHGAIYFATACHVLFERGTGVSGKPRAAHALLLSYPEENLGGPIFMELDLIRLLQQGAIKIHPTEDAIVVRIGTIQAVGMDKKIVADRGCSSKGAGQSTIEWNTARSQHAHDQEVSGSDDWKLNLSFRVSRLARDSELSAD